MGKIRDTMDNEVHELILNYLFGFTDFPLKDGLLIDDIEKVIVGRYKGEIRKFTYDEHEKTYNKYK